jgi:CDP-paratose 2-epimerase
MDSAGTHPHSPYGVSKASADLLCQEWFHAFDIPTVVMRMSCIYGLYQNGVSEQGWTDFFVRQRILGDNKLIFYGNGKQVRDCLFGTDAADAYLMALDKIDTVKGQVFNLGGGKFNTSLIEWVDILNTYTDKPKMEISYDEWRLADHRVYISDTSKIERVLGWKANTDIPTGIKLMVEAYQGGLYAA